MVLVGEVKIAFIAAKLAHLGTSNHHNHRIYNRSLFVATIAPHVLETVTLVS